MNLFNGESLPPVELFLRDYVEARDGVWDEIEPKVYDLLVESDTLQVSFDPEALLEHPRAQLASLGSPLFDRFLSDASGRWSSARLYRNGLNTEPYDLESRFRRSLKLPAGATAATRRIRAMNCPQAIFWFKASFASDQKEEEIMRVGIDLHYDREVRQLDSLLAFERLSDVPDRLLPEARHDGLLSGYRTARSHVMRSIAALANARRREWSGTIQKQTARMAGYYAQLRREIAEQATHTGDPDRAAARAQSRLDSIDREESLRIAELKRKSTLRVDIKLCNLMIVEQPKLLISLSLTAKDGRANPLEIVWDPLADAMEPFPCPRCGKPTFAVDVDRMGPRCSQCPRQ